MSPHPPPENPPAGANEPDPFEFTSEDAESTGPTLIPDYVRSAAEQLRHGQLEGEIIERYAADDRYVRPFLEAVATGDEERAFRVLAGMLAGNPGLFDHPYVSRQLRHLYTVFSVLDPGITDRALEVRIKLIKAWAEGMTLGWKVSITKPATGRPGQAPQYFPHLDDREGWLPTPRAIKEELDAEEFVRVYGNLKARLSKAVPWKALRAQYGPSQHGPVYKARDLVRGVFEEFKQQEGISQPPLEPSRLLDIARAGLKEPKGRNPADRVARELLATLPYYTVTGAPLTLDASGIKSSLETLRKRGIPKRAPSK